MRTTTKKSAIVPVLSSLLLAGTALANGNGNNKPLQPIQPQQQQSQSQTDMPKHVDLVIALDTSSSMNGLIDSARQKLWDVVNVLATAKPKPVLRVGLISYGNDGYDSGRGWVRKESDLTTDLDGLYSKLFALRTNGGSEYVARAVRDGTRDMQWEKTPGTLKIIFVAGNEPANQDPQIPVESAVQEARERGIFVNAIYCGSESNGEAVGWRQVATMGRGQYAAIDHNRVVAINTPMDAELARLSAELNKTYVAYGAAGSGRAANQAAQDNNAQSLGASAAASRATAKSSALYDNGDWDLVDAKKKGKDVAKLRSDELPAEMRGMNEGERKAYVEKKAKEREALRRQISEISTKRDAYIKQQRAAAPKPAQAAFDDAVTGAIKTEAESAGFAF